MSESVVEVFTCTCGVSAGYRHKSDCDLITRRKQFIALEVQKAWQRWTEVVPPDTSDEGVAVWFTGTDWACYKRGIEAYAERQWAWRQKRQTDRERKQMADRKEKAEGPDAPISQGDQMISLLTEIRDLLRGMER